MSRFVEGQDRSQVTLIPECLDDFIAQDNPVRVVDAFVQELDLSALGSQGTMPASTGHPAYDPAVLLKIYIYGYLNRVQSSRRLEREFFRPRSGSMSTSHTASVSSRYSAVLAKGQLMAGVDAVDKSSRRPQIALPHQSAG